jgi:hypothetical protein
MATFGVIQFTTRGRLTGKVFGPFTEEAAGFFVESAQVGGYHYVRVKVEGTFRKEAVLDAARIVRPE